MKKKTYWQNAEALSRQRATPDKPEKHQEFPEPLPTQAALKEAPSRRDFLKLMGFSLGAVSLAACEAPVRKSIPYLNKPETLDPGVPNYYASTYMRESEYCSVVVKTREGRPIKIEGNARSPVSGGGVTARIEASLLSLYDEQRHTAPMINQREVSWEAMDRLVSDTLPPSPTRGND